MILHLRRRKFFCPQQACSQRIFTERHPAWCRPYARKTDRLRSFLAKLAFSLAAEAASRLAPCYGVRVSADTFLALVRSELLRAFQAPAVIGLDDWAMKKGHQYGTLICDLETKRPIGLLAGRTTESVKAWLALYPSIRMVTRDGSREYAKAIAEALPDALQITDRWHLFHHVSRSVDHWLKRLSGKGENFGLVSFLHVRSQRANLAPVDRKGRAKMAYDPTGAGSASTRYFDLPHQRGFVSGPKDGPEILSPPDPHETQTPPLP